MEGESFADKLIPPFSFRRLPSGRGMYLKIIDISERKGNIMTKKKKYGKVQVKNFKWIYAFLLPTIIIFVMFYVQPIAVMLTTSFTKWDGFNDPSFNGISNYIKLFTNSASAASIKNLILWSAIAMTFHVGFGVLTYVLCLFVPYQKLLGVIMTYCGYTGFIVFFVIVIRYFMVKSKDEKEGIKA